MPLPIGPISLQETFVCSLGWLIEARGAERALDGEGRRAMLGAKSALAIRACGLVMTTGLLTVLITPSTELHTGATSPLAAFKHVAPDTAPDSDQSSAYGYGSTFPADPPAEPYLGPDRPYERPINYLDNVDDLSSVSDEADGSLKRAKRHLRADRDAFNDNESKELADLDKPAAGTPISNSEGGSSDPEMSVAKASPTVDTADLRPTPATQTVVSYPRPPAQ